MKKLLVILSLLTGFTATAVNAMTIAENSDFPNAWTYDLSYALFLGELDPGLNTISGSLAGLCLFEGCNSDNGAPDDQQDSFLIKVGSGFQLDGLTVTISNSSGVSGFTAGIEFDIPSSITPIYVHSFPLNATSENLLADSVLPASIYNISMFGHRALGGGEYAFDYTVRLNVSPVPIPAAIWLFGAGLCGLFAFKRR